MPIGRGMKAKLKKQRSEDVFAMSMFTAQHKKKPTRYRVRFKSLDVKVKGTHTMEEIIAKVPQKQLKNLVIEEAT